MLVLTRKNQESIIGIATMDLPIGSKIEIKVLSIEGNNVRLGISAPNGLTVHRSEIWAKIKNIENNQKKED